MSAENNDPGDISTFQWVHMPVVFSKCFFGYLSSNTILKFLCVRVLLERGRERGRWGRKGWGRGLTLPVGARLVLVHWWLHLSFAPSASESPVHLFGHLEREKQAAAWIDQSHKVPFQLTWLVCSLLVYSVINMQRHPQLYLGPDTALLPHYNI